MLHAGLHNNIYPAASADDPSKGEAHTSGVGALSGDTPWQVHEKQPASEAWEENAVRRRRWC